MKTCVHCGHTSEDMKFAGYFGFSKRARPDQLGHYPTPQYACADEATCLLRQDEANKEWQQAMGVKDV